MGYVLELKSITVPGENEKRNHGFFFFLCFYLESVANKDREHMKNMLCVMDEGSLWRDFEMAIGHM